MSRAIRRCVQSPLNGEFTLCGDACDGPASEADMPDHRVAQADESVTCVQCCEFIRAMKAIRNRLRPTHDFMGQSE